ncbi:MAG: type VI secretion system baseplate subunit TssG [Chitinophagaceae bacterium]|nr:type VI secretion system baseplate subunit TssG [Chitinophagaceae bacterium]
MKNEQLETLLKEMTERLHDIRAEVLMCQAVDKNVDIENIITSFANFFQREFSRDVTHTALEQDDWFREFITLELTRPGFYDMLPEGLFFQPQPADYSLRAVDAGQMAVQYRVDKAREKEIRKFFQPFEHEFFVQQLLLEKQESALIEYFQDPIPDIWNLPEILPENTRTSLLLLLPYAHQVAGNLTLMEKSLSLILNEPVCIQIKNTTDTQVIDEVIMLGEQELGTNMVCGNHFWEPSVSLNYIIGPLNKDKISAYLPEGTLRLTIDTFNRFFAPADADIEITLELGRQQQAILDKKKELILGYSTVL